MAGVYEVGGSKERSVKSGRKAASIPNGTGTLRL